VSGVEINVGALAPIIWMSAGSMVVLVSEIVMKKVVKVGDQPMSSAWVGTLLAAVAVAALLGALGAASAAFSSGEVEVFNLGNPMYQLDPFSSLLMSVIALGALLSCLLSIAYLRELQINYGEYYALILMAAAGMMLMVAAVDMLAVFMGLELMSIPIYVLAGMDRRRLRSNEAAMKYFLIGAFASAVMLYGMALLYGAGGSTAFDGVRAAVETGTPMAMIGVGLVIVGFAFKISSVPFHQWTPDVYEGAPVAVTAFMSVTVKATAVGALLRFVGLGLGSLDASLVDVLWVLAVLTMVVGNLMAVIQDNVKRLLAYSSIAHAGYILVGLVAGTPDGYAAVVFYLIAYTFMNLGAFGVVVALAEKGHECERVDSFAGLSRQRPTLAAMMTLFMVALAGIPPTLGFFAKFKIFQAAVTAGQVPLAVIGVLMSVVSVYYYLRIPVLMYMREPGEETPRMTVHSGEAFVLAVCTLAVVALGLFPNDFGGIHLTDWARESVRLLFP
jgi:NADH-quinone oxidoreductase subunit N